MRSAMSEQHREPDHPERGAGIAAVVLAVTGFSWGFIIVKVIGLPPPVLAFWRLLIGATVLLGVAWMMRVPLPARTPALLFSGLTFAAHQLLFVTATNATSVAIVTLVAASQPLLVGLVSHRIVGERVAPSLLGYALLAVAGVAVVVHANFGHASQSLLGDALAVLNLFAFTAYFLAAKRARSDGAPALTFTGGVLCIACALVLPFMLWWGPEAPNVRQTGLLAFLALGSGNGHLLINWAHPRVSAAFASLILAAVPILSSVWAHLVLDEPYTWRHVVGMLLVLAAIEGGRRVESRAGKLDPREAQVIVE